MRKKKVGLILAYQGTNYGAQLQAFATQVVLETLGVDTEIIEYSTENNSRRIPRDKDYILHILPIIVYNKVFKKNEVVVTDPTFLENRKLRLNAKTLFIQENLHNIVKIAGYNNLVSYSKQFDAILVGSDQKWVPGFSFGGIDSLKFVPKVVRRISFSTSLGVSEYPKYCWKTARDCWNNIDYLSVREEQGADIIKKVCGNIPVQVLCDPTYTITKEQWEKLIPIQSMCKEKYILAYFLGNDESIFKSARSYADKQGIKLVTLPSCESYSPLAFNFADYNIKGASPKEFVNWVRGAECVLTDSFHGLAFSVINEKQFFIYYRKRDDAKMSRNSRIDNVLEKWGLKDRLIVDKTLDWEKVQISQIDYSIVTPLVLKERDKALEFLTNALYFDGN